MTGDLAARLQFAVAAVTHGLFASTTVGLITVIAVAQTLGHRRGDAGLTALARAWTAPYVVVYVFGIAAGMVLEVQFGLDWGGLVDRAGNVVGAPLTVETLTTFIAESTLLALWTFGWDVIRPRTHLVLVWGVVLTAVLSIFWSLVANSWLQQPSGFSLEHGMITLTSFAALFTGATLWVSLAHVLGASWALGGALVAGVGAARLRRCARTGALVRSTDALSVRWGAAVAAGGAVLAVIAGFQSLSYLRTTQPGKLASFSGSTPLRAALARQLQQRYGRGDWLPPAWIVAPAMLMIVLGFVVAAVSVWILASPDEERPLFRAPALRYLPITAVLPFITVVSGWVVREVGRQPWVVYGLVRTSEGATSMSPLRAGTSLAAVTLVCAATLTGAFLLTRRILRSPGPQSEGAAAEPAPVAASVAGQA